MTFLYKIHGKLVAPLDVVQYKMSKKKVTFIIIFQCSGAICGLLDIRFALAGNRTSWKDKVKNIFRKKGAEKPDGGTVDMEVDCYTK